MRVNLGVLLVILILFEISFVTGQFCSDSQTIMKLYQSSNSHGALWNYSYDPDYDSYPNLVSWWKLDDGTGNIAVDSNGSNDGTIYGASWTGGRFNNALEFDGVDDKVIIPSSMNLTNLSVSVILWVYINSASCNGSFIKIGNESGSGGDGYAIGVGETQYDDRGNDLILLFEGRRWIDTNTPIGTGWHQVAMVISNLGIPQAFIDGISIGSYPGLNATIPTNNTEIGGYTSSIPANRHFNGTLDNIAVYNRSLTSSEIADLYNSQSRRYNYRICYDDIFGMAYSEADPHNCQGDINDPENVVLWLSDYNNSHASTEKITGYDIPVCYGDLVCRNTTDSCTANEEIVVRLYSESNSHISNASGSYSIKICCESEGTKLKEVYWAYQDGTKINQVNKVDLNDLVMAVAEGTGLNKTGITYRIYRKVGGIFDWLWPDTLEGQKGEKDHIDWRAGENESGDLRPGLYYFTANISVDEINSTEDNPYPYRYLNVSDEEDNDPPKIQIMNLTDRGIYFLGENLNFTIEVSDSDDDFNYTWDLGNGIKKTGDSINWGNLSFIYDYDEVDELGQKNIIVEAVDERGAENRSRISILIVNSSYFLAYIDEPDWNQHIDSYKFNFNASGTYAVNASWLPSGEMNITCTAGKCPTEAEGVPPGYDCGTFTCPIPVRNTPQDYDGLYFEWVYDNKVSKNGTGWGLVNHTMAFGYVGSHAVNLTVNDSAQTNVRFYIHFSNPSCARCPEEFSDSDYCWWEDDGLTVTNSTEDCYRANGVSEDGTKTVQSCCPSVEGVHYTCDSGMCIPEIDPVGKYYCEVFDGDKEGCESEQGDQKAAQYFASKGFNCDPSSAWTKEGCTWWNKCECKYTVGECEPSKTLKYRCTNGDEGAFGSCIYNSTFDDSRCEITGFMEETISYGWTGSSDTRPPGCPIEPAKFRRPCADVVRLNFFTWVNFLIAVLIVIAIYYFTNPKKKSPKKKSG
ncbi:hypothetical protein GF386_03555 [Candidatus Pacearchaeota archaeon]|nr:hypothetical protein [Candidatus Pacearchaeota archaeon]MBD3283227.1 hypothetical protein [Candidatus Pacearchaeota archaeon]